MIWNKIKVYHYFWIVSILIVAIGLYENRFSDSSPLDVNIIDTYYIIPNYDITFVLSVVYFLTGFGYYFVTKIIKKQLIPALTFIHSLILIGGFISYWLTVGYSKLKSDNNFPLFDDLQIVNVTVSILILTIVFIGQPIYIINLVIAVFKKK